MAPAFARIRLGQFGVGANRPAFDSEVSAALKIGRINDSAQWQSALAVVNADIRAFEQKNGVSFSEAKPPRFATLHNGRVYDMALGPR